MVSKFFWENKSAESCDAEQRLKAEVFDADKCDIALIKCVIVLVVAGAMLVVAANANIKRADLAFPMYIATILLSSYLIVTPNMSRGVANMEARRSIKQLQEIFCVAQELQKSPAHVTGPALYDIFYRRKD